MTYEEAGHYCPPSWRCQCGEHAWSECMIAYDGGKAIPICPDAAQRAAEAALLAGADYVDLELADFLFD